MKMSVFGKERKPKSKVRIYIFNNKKDEKKEKKRLERQKRRLRKEKEESLGPEGRRFRLWVVTRSAKEEKEGRNGDQRFLLW